MNQRWRLKRRPQTRTDVGTNVTELWDSTILEYNDDKTNKRGKKKKRESGNATTPPIPTISQNRVEGENRMRKKNGECGKKRGAGRWGGWPGSEHKPMEHSAMVQKKGNRNIE